MIVSELDTAGNMYVLYQSFTMARMLYVREECAAVCIVCIAGVVPYINKGLVFHCMITLDPQSCAYCEVTSTLSPFVSHPYPEWSDICQPELYAACTLQA